MPMLIHAITFATLAGHSAIIAPPDLASLASEWIENGDGVPGVPVDSPSVATPLGSVGTCSMNCTSVLGFNSWITGPFVQGACGASLFVNGKYLRCGKHQWLPFEARRRPMVSEDPVVRDLETTTRVLDDGSGTKALLFNISLGHSGMEALLEVDLSPMVSQLNFLAWPSAWPSDAEFRTRFNFTILNGSMDGSTNRSLLVIQDHFSALHATTITGFVTPTDSIDASLVKKGPTKVIATLNATGQAWIGMFVVVAENVTSSLFAASRLGSLGAFQTAWSLTEQRWRTRWAAAFTRGNMHYPGNLPTLETEDAQVARIYYMACVTLLAHERSTYPKVAPRVYLTGYGTIYDTTVYGGSVAFFWDQSLLARLHSLLDPEWMRNYLTTALGNGNFDSNIWVELMTGQTGGGYWYAFNTISLFWMIEGYIAISGDIAFLYNTTIKGVNILGWLEHLSLEWTKPDYNSTPGGPHPYLADYGGDLDNFLEMVPTYVHTVASLQAQNARMMRVVAKLRSLEGNETGAARLETLAAHVSEAVRTKLYLPGQGFFGTLHGDKLVPVATVLDFIYVTDALAADLDIKQRQEMRTFFNRHLRRSHWMLALSPADPIASRPETKRDDHGWTGAYASWPAYSVQALALLGEANGTMTEATQFLRDTSAATSSGMYGQAHYVRPGPGVPFKDWYPSGTRFAELNGASFAQVVLQCLFGFWPEVRSLSLTPEIKLWRPAMPRDFKGVLHNVRLPNDVHVSICSGEDGLKVNCEETLRSIGEQYV